MITEHGFWLRNNESITCISTLGPVGSSSEAAALHMEILLGRKLKIHLFSSFELASAYTENHTDCALLVANAYRDSDYFYMNPKTTLMGSFFFSPPHYFICSRSKDELKRKLENKKRISIVTHNAPASRLNDVISSMQNNGYEFSEDKIEVHYTEATSKGAQDVSNGLYDCCLSNEIAAKHSNLEIISLPLIIEMTWVVFVKTNINLKEHKQCLLSDVKI